MGDPDYASGWHASFGKPAADEGWRIFDRAVGVDVEEFEDVRFRHAVGFHDKADDGIVQEYNEGTLDPASRFDIGRPKGNGLTGIMWRLTLLGAIFAFVIFSGSVTAAEVELLDLPGKIDIVSIKGEVTVGDSDRFSDLVRERDRITVILQSPGGLVKEALQIGAEIRIRNFATMVAPDGECFSACGLIWVSGARRYMSPDSKIGFHAAYREENGEYKDAASPTPKLDPS